MKREKRGEERKRETKKEEKRLDRSSGNLPLFCNS